MVTADRRDRGNAVLEARRILILAPHPDDEVVACGVAALRARAAGARVLVLYLTTGVPDRNILWAWQRPSHDARVRRRRREALVAAASLGLEPFVFRATASRCLRADLDAAAGDLDAAIGDSGAEALWVPAFEGRHQDHDAANALAASVAGRLPVWEFASVNFAGGHMNTNSFADEHGGELAIEATPAEAERKRRAMHCYASNAGNLHFIGADREACRPLPAHDYGVPPHPGRLLRERFHAVPFRHPRIDFTPSAEVYRDISTWVAAGRRSPVASYRRALPPLDDRPGDEPR